MAKAYNAVAGSFHRVHITYDRSRLITQDFMVPLDFEERQQLRYDLVKPQVEMRSGGAILDIGKHG